MPASPLSNERGFTVRYPDASNIQVTPNVWQAGQTHPSPSPAPTIGIIPYDITYTTPVLQSSGTMTSTVTVPSSETSTEANVYVTPANTRCTAPATWPATLPIPQASRPSPAVVSIILARPSPTVTNSSDAALRATAKATGGLP